MANYKEKINKPYIKIAAILDEFSYECLKYECTILQLTPDNYKEILVNEKPHLLLVESAWRGEANSWIYKTGGLNHSCDQTLKNVTALCKQLNIPSVFWNKEDPIHFNYFLSAAELFDYIFTTDINCVKLYKKLLKKEKVYPLLFAAQPKIHNPIGRNEKIIGNVAFAGTWYAYGSIVRKKAINIILKPSINYGLHIYDRMYNYNKANGYTYPDIYRPFVKGFLPYLDMISVYKKYKLFLNVNSTANSKTMFSRRVFELLACGTCIISSYSIGIKNLFPDIVTLCSSSRATNHFIRLLLSNEELRDRIALKGIREIFSNHTYSHRIEEILEKLAIPYEKNHFPLVTIIAYANNEAGFKNIILNYSAQTYKNKKAIIFIAFPFDNQIDKDINLKDIKIISKKALTLNIIYEYYNYGISLSSPGYIGFFHEDDIYSDNYITDLINTFQYTNADIAGKNTYYVWDKETKSIFKQNGTEYNYVDSVSFYAMMIKKDIFDFIKLENGGVDSMKKKFFNNYRDKGKQVYSSDRFGYIKGGRFNMDFPKGSKAPGGIEDYSLVPTIPYNPPHSGRNNNILFIIIIIILFKGVS